MCCGPAGLQMSCSGDDINPNNIPPKIIRQPSMALQIWDAQVSKWFFDHRLYVGGEIINMFDNRHMNTKDYMSAGRLMNIKVAVNINR